MCFLSSPCNDEYNGTNIFQIGLVVFEKITKVCENGAKKCLTDSDFWEFPSLTQPKSNPTRTQNWSAERLQNVV